MVHPGSDAVGPARDARPVRAAMIGTGNIAKVAHLPGIAALDGTVSADRTRP
jgi:predicted dehydrogenase